MKQYDKIYVHATRNSTGKPVGEFYPGTGIRIYDIIEEYLKNNTLQNTVNIGNSNLTLTSNRILNCDDKNFTFLEANNFNIVSTYLTFNIANSVEINTYASSLLLDTIDGVNAGFKQGDYYLGLGKMSSVLGDSELGCLNANVINATIEAENNVNITAANSINATADNIRLLSDNADFNLQSNPYLTTIGNYSHNLNNEGRYILSNDIYTASLYTMKLSFNVNEVFLRTQTKSDATTLQQITLNPSVLRLEGKIAFNGRNLSNAYPTIAAGYVWSALDNTGRGAWTPLPTLSLVQSDWNVTDTGSSAFILNKPTIPVLTWNNIQNKPIWATVAYTAEYTHLLNRPTIPAAQIQSDWNQTNTSALDFIKNKPAIGTAPVNADWAATSGLAQILNKPNIPTVIDYKTIEQLIPEKWINNAPIYQLTVVASSGASSSSIAVDLSSNISGTIAEVISIDIKNRWGDNHRTDYGQNVTNFNSNTKTLSSGSTTTNVTFICTLKYTKV